MKIKYVSMRITRDHYEMQEEMDFRPSKYSTDTFSDLIDKYIDSTCYIPDGDDMIDYINHHYSELYLSGVINPDNVSFYGGIEKAVESDLFDDEYLRLESNMRNSLLTLASDILIRNNCECILIEQWHDILDIIDGVELDESISEFTEAILKYSFDNMGIIVG